MSTNTLTAPPTAVVPRDRRFTMQVDSTRIEQALRSHAEFRQMANAAGSGIPSYIAGPHSEELVRPSGQLMADDEFQNRMSQVAATEWDTATNKLRWVE